MPLASAKGHGRSFGRPYGTRLGYVFTGNNLRVECRNLDPGSAPVIVGCGDGATAHWVTIPTSIGSPLRVRHVPPAPDAMIVLLPGTGATGASLAADFARSAGAGFGAVLCNSPSCGGSIGGLTWSKYEWKAFPASVTWIRDQPGQGHPIIEPAVTVQVYECSGNRKRFRTSPCGGHTGFLSLPGPVYRNRPVFCRECPDARQSPISLTNGRGSLT